MKILVIGASGMLGHKLVQCWRGKFDVWATLRGGHDSYARFGIFESKKIVEEVDAEDFETVARAIEKVRPDVIFNAVGVIKQLPTSKDVVKTLTINSIFPHRLAEIAAKSAARLINIGTDCVFDGKKGNYKEEDVSDATDLYGKSKNLGEVVEGNCLTLRTSIIGRELRSEHSMVEWFLTNRGKTVKGFTNAIYTGFPTVVMAEILADVIENRPDLRGLYHVSSAPINKYELLKMIREAYRAEIEIEPFDDFRIDRSLDSTRFRQAVGFRPPSWREMIEKMAADRTPYDEWRK
ncbi:MAG TPA: SDR family oxidoreductase [Pyrinomonadaceae bacterium]|jgi:dTDP-4-dehydrorhamnose reductase